MKYNIVFSKNIFYICKHFLCLTEELLDIFLQAIALENIWYSVLKLFTSKEWYIAKAKYQKIEN